MILLHSTIGTTGMSLVEPAIFLSGITGFKSKSEDGINHWEVYIRHYSAENVDCKVLLHCLYEAQNEEITPHYFTAEESRRSVCIGSRTFNSLSTPFDSYVLSYCLAHYLDQFTLSITIEDDHVLSLLETLVKGLEDHCTANNTPPVAYLVVEMKMFMEVILNTAILWLLKAKFLPTVKRLLFIQRDVNSDLINVFLQSLVKLQWLRIESIGWPTSQHPISLEWLAALKSLSEMKQLYISISDECSPLPAGFECGPVSHTLREVDIDINLPSNTAYDLRSSTDGMVDSLLKSVLRSYQITKVCLPNISRATMAGVRGILLHCPCLDTLKLKRTRLGYDGILYICSALRNNTSLTHLMIHDDLPVPISSSTGMFFSFSSMERAALPDKTTCTDFLLELNNILKDNNSLKKIDIQSGLFFPLPSDGRRSWTRTEPLQQFNVGAVGSGRSPNLRRSLSSSDLNHPQALLFCNKWLDKRQFSKRKEEAFSIPSSTAPDTEVLQSFSGLDPRLKQCLGISQFIQHYFFESSNMRQQKNLRLLQLQLFEHCIF